MRIDKRSLLLSAAMAASGLAVVLTTPQSASAWPPYLTEWQSIYPGSATDDHAIAGTGTGCVVCHIDPAGGSPWNPYGWEIRQKFLGGSTLHDAILQSALWDSELNPRSWSNIVEINASSQPGWTAGLNNVSYSDSGVTTGLPPAGVVGPLDPASSPMVPMCDPDVSGVIACPCGNPQSGINRGCNNSSSTTGAALTAVGTASLAADSLVFTTAGERATAFSILLQGPAVIPGGTIYGQGVRCVAGALKRLFNKSAVGGSILVPDFGLGDPTISARSAAKGDVIMAGESRYYLVYYRDPNVLGGCPVTSTFNATQTGVVAWAP